MYARVSRYEVPVGMLEADVQGAEETERKVSAMPGSLGLYYFVDRETGQTMSITLWEDEASMRDSEAPASARPADRVGAGPGYWRRWRVVPVLLRSDRRQEAARWEE